MPGIVKLRGHLIPKDYPFVVATSMEALNKTKSVVKKTRAKIYKKAYG